MANRQKLLKELRQKASKVRRGRAMAAPCPACGEPLPPEGDDGRVVFFVPAMDPEPCAACLERAEGFGLGALVVPMGPVSLEKPDVDGGLMRDGGEQ